MSRALLIERFLALIDTPWNNFREATEKLEQLLDAGEMRQPRREFTPPLPDEAAGFMLAARKIVARAQMLRPYLPNKPLRDIGPKEFDIYSCIKELGDQESPYAEIKMWVERYMTVESQWGFLTVPWDAVWDAGPVDQMLSLINYDPNTLDKLECLQRAGELVEWLDTLSTQYADLLDLEELKVTEVDAKVPGLGRVRLERERDGKLPIRPAVMPPSYRSGDGPASRTPRGGQ